METVGIIANTNKSNVINVANKIITFFERNGVKIILEKPLSKMVRRKNLGALSGKLAKTSDLIISLGGDGTFLRSARIAYGYNKPILGVNLGGLGFLSEVTPDSLEKDLQLLLNGRYNVDYRATLDVLLERGSKKISISHALNDVVISKKELSRIISLEIFVNNEYMAVYKADGVVISTPTGSTAYNLSAGGPITHPMSEVVVISPICPHTLAHRPVVIPRDSRIDIGFTASLKDADAELTVDGQIGLDLKKGDKVVITKGKEKIPVILFKGTSYFEVLRKKLGWGAR